MLNQLAEVRRTEQRSFDQQAHHISTAAAATIPHFTVELRVDYLEPDEASRLQSLRHGNPRAAFRYLFHVGRKGDAGEP